MGCRFRSYCTLDDTCHAYGSLYNQCDSSDNIYSGQQSRCSSPSPPPRPSGCYQTSCGGDQASCYQFSFSGSSLEVTETLQSGGDNCLFNFNFGLSYVDSDRVRFEENGTCSISSCSSSSCTCSSSLNGMLNYNLQGNVLTLVDGSQNTIQLTEATCKSYDNSDNCSSNSSSSMGLIIGIVCAVGVVLLLVALALVWCYCVRPQHQGDGGAESAVVMKQV